MNEDVGNPSVVAASRTRADKTSGEGHGRCGEEEEGGMETTAYKMGH